MYTPFQHYFESQTSFGRPVTPKNNTARYQQKQLKDREEKVQSLYGDQDKAKGNNIFNLVGRGGKVRQLFQERRLERGPGWDRSRPLEPLREWKRGQSLDRLRTDDSPELVGRAHTDRAFQISPDAKAGYRLSNVGGNRYVLMEQPKTNVTTKPKSRLPYREVPNGEIASLTKNMSRLSATSRNTVVKQQTTYGHQRDKPEVQPHTSTVRPSIPSPKKSPSSLIGRPLPQKEKSVAETAKPLPVKSIPVQKKVEHRPSDPDQMACQFCGRYFNNERLPLHENICKKTTTKKRKVFDPVKHRLEGTDAESYLRKQKQVQSKQKVNQPAVQKADWRKKHEEFIANIRAAKIAKAHIAKGGKLSDLPPPPPMDTSDYIQCPHCGRKFCQAAAERHIPKCANIINNKPKPNARVPPQRKR